MSHNTSVHSSPSPKISRAGRRSRPSRRRRVHPHEDNDGPVPSFAEVVDRRTSIRSFTDDPVSDQSLRDALLLARRAPSAGNLQAYQVVIVRDEETKLAIGRAAVGQMWIADAPVVLVFLAHPDRSGIKYGRRGRSLYAVQDATIAAAYAQLALEAEGLASCWVGAFQEDIVAASVGSSYYYGGEEGSRGSGLRPVVVMPVGVQAGGVTHRHHRRELEEFVHDGYYGARFDGNTARDEPKQALKSAPTHKALT